VTVRRKADPKNKAVGSDWDIFLERMQRRKGLGGGLSEWKGPRNRSREEIPCHGTNVDCIQLIERNGSHHLGRNFERGGRPIVIQ